MEKAIKKAIEGGYQETEQLVDERDYWVFFDRKFWEALSKAENWKWLWWRKIYGDFSPATKSHRWKYEMHRLADHLIEGKSADSFFEELLK
jgi:hypothetical protein